MRTERSALKNSSRASAAEALATLAVEEVENFSRNNLQSRSGKNIQEWASENADRKLRIEPGDPLAHIV